MVSLIIQILGMFGIFQRVAEIDTGKSFKRRINLIYLFGLILDRCVGRQIIRNDL